jgi:glycerol-3-phosphate acyltransferase PlsY
MQRITLVLMLLSYLLGAVPFSFLVARACGVDLRRVGSGNIGSGNVWRSCGFRPFLLAFALDALKGAALPLLAIRRFHLSPLSVILVGASAMLGHTCSVFLRFKGGKAVATSAGVLLVIFPRGILAAAATWIALVVATRITSVGSLGGAGVVIVLALIAAARRRLHPLYAAFACAAGVVVVVLHRTNIQRLRDGTENRLQKLF